MKFKKPNPYIKPNNRLKTLAMLFKMMDLKICRSYNGGQLHVYTFSGDSVRMILYYPDCNRLVFTTHFTAVINDLDSATENLISNLFSNIHDLKVKKTKWKYY